MQHSVKNESLFSQGRTAACIGGIALISLLAFESIAVAAAMPAVAAALGGLDFYAIAFGGTLASSVVGMTLGGEICDRYGAARSAWLGLAAFIAGLLAAGAASDISMLVLGRLMQGLGSGLLGVAIYVGMSRAVPPSLHPKLFAMFAGAWVVPALIGPGIAAGLVHIFGWRAVFLAVAALAPVAGALLLPALSRQETPAGAAKPMRWPRLGWSLLAACGALALHGSSHLPQTQYMLSALAVGFAFAFFAARRLLPAGSLRAAEGLPSVVAMRGLIAAAFFASEAFIPLILTTRYHWSLGSAGLALTASALMWSMGSATQARLHGEAARRRGLTIGFAAMAAGLSSALAAAALSLHAGWVVAGWAVTGLGIGLSFPMLSVLTMKLSRPDEQGSNASALQLSDALSSSIALALAGMLIHALARPSAPPDALPILAMSALLALIGAWVSPRAFPRGAAGQADGADLPVRHQH
ncbi:MFS transporter [Chromobacterium vaccinii]|uniref:MFS transporter n=1 Tax=Chromobacterium vaccinii TaxID=1108595 RepID=UPI0031D9910D